MRPGSLTYRAARVAAAFLLAAATFATFTAPASAFTFAVDSTADAPDVLPGDGICDDGSGNCTLRAAVQEANANPGTDTVTLPSGVFVLTVAGSGEDDAATGDLDVLEPLTLLGAGASVTTVRQSGADRVLDIRPGATLTASGLSIESGSETLGGGVRVDSATLRLTSVELSSSSAGSRGGGFHASDAVVELDRVTIAGNTASLQGGGGFATDSTVTVTNSTVSGNSAGSRGGGLRHQRGQLTLSFSTIAANTATNGGGLAWNGPVAFSVSNTMIADNGAENCDDPVASSGHNLDSGTSCGFSAPGDISGANPDVSPLGYHGGSTRTHALTLTSPAIDAAASVCTQPIDQRGTVRPQDGDAVPGARCDIGAFEYETGILNAAPVLDPIPPQSGDELTLIQFTAVAHDDNPGDTLAFRLEDGTGAVPAGAAIDAGSGQFTWNPTAAQGPATYVFDVVVADDGTPVLEDRQQVTVTVTEPNHAPTITTPGDRASDEGDAIAMSIVATDPDGDGLSWSASGLPPGLSLNETTGVISGTLPYSASVGSPYSVTVSVVDDGDPSLGDSTEFTWAVGDVNRSPILSNPGTVGSSEGDTVSLFVSATDPDGDELTWVASGLPDGLSIDGSTGEIAGAIDWDTADSSPFSVSVTVVDDGAPSRSDTASFIWVISDTNRAPTLDPVPDQEHAEGAEVSLTIRASDPDDSADSLTFDVDNLPPGLSMDPASGEISGTLPYTAALHSPYTVTVTVRDAGSPVLSSTETFEWLVVNTNRRPWLSVAASHEGDELTVITFTASASDRDGDSLVFSLVAGADAVPAGATIDPRSGVFMWTPGADQGPAVYEFGIAVTDSGSPRLSAIRTVTITVIEPNLPPIAGADVLSVDEDGELEFDLLANDIDPEQKTLVVTHVDGPRHGKLSRLGNGVFSYRPDRDWNGSELLGYAVSDGVNPVVHQVVRIFVSPHNDAPRAFDVSRSVRAGDTVAIDLTAITYDADGDPLTFELFGTPRGAVVAWQEPQVLTLQTKVGFDGAFSVAYVARDESGEQAAARISLLVDGPTHDLGVPALLGGFDGGDVPEASPARIPSSGFTFTGMRLIVGSVFQTFTLFRLPGLVFLLVFGLSIFVGTRKDIAIGEGAVHLPDETPRTVAAIQLNEGRKLVARSEPGDHAEIVYRFPPDARNLAATGRTAQLGNRLWIELDTASGRAWVDGAFVTSQIAEAEFAADPRPRQLVAELRRALCEDGDLSDISAAQGLFVAHRAMEGVIPRDELTTIAADPSIRSWWRTSESEERKRGTFKHMVAEPLVASLDSYPLRSGTSSATAVPTKIANLPSLSVGHPTIPGKDAWRIFFEYDSEGSPRMFAIWKDAPSNHSTPGAHD